MTGFGRGTARAGTTESTVEVRAVNGRFAEVAVRAPRLLNPHEAAIQARCKEALERGSISASVALLRAGADLPLRVNAPAARAYAQLLHDLRDAAGLDAPITVDHLLRYPDVFSSEGGADEGAGDEAWAATASALAEALSQLDAMRLQEGARLADDLQQRLRLIEEHLAVVEARAPARVSEARDRLRDRLSELLADERLNPDRLETELALLADRLDVTEECVRLRAHLDAFRDALAAEDAVGRRLNFLAQELNREVNTIGSKANDAELTGRAVAMKEEVEKIREQVQNVV